MMVEAVHFTGDEPPGRIARKLLRVNLSDLAAKGAKPCGYLLAMAIPASTGKQWLQEFADGLRRDQEGFGCALWGGDSVSTSGPKVFSLTLIGERKEGAGVHRGGAKAGDKLYVTGTIGDAALGLKILRGEIAGDSSLVARLELPTPRMAFGTGLPDLAHAAIDISDGLLADAGHLARESHVRIDIQASEVPLSPAAERAIAGNSELLLSALTGGDDYELLVTVPEKNVVALTEFAEETATPLTAIGDVRDGSGVCLLNDQGRSMDYKRAGFEHFQE